MPNQHDIAAALGITQAAVSMALRGNRAISSEVREKVLRTAEKMGYRPHMYANALISNIRSGKNPSESSVIGLLIESSSPSVWYESESFRIFHQGVIQRGKELGFRIDSFFLKKPGMSDSKVDAILHARGIDGIILAPPYYGNRALQLHWERYASIGVGFGWEKQELHRVVFDQCHNFIMAFSELRRMGYRRIGTVLGERLVRGNRRGTQWYTGYLECQDRIPKNERIRVLDAPSGDRMRIKFYEWFKKWKPDAVLTLVGEEKAWLEAIGLRIPEDVGLACLAQPFDLSYAHIDEMGEDVGATALELVAAQIARNEFGMPSHPKTMMIEGRWVDGTTLQSRN